MKGIFGSMFDLNHDGNISPLESAMEFTFLNELLKDDSDVQTELELSGLERIFVKKSYSIWRQIY